MLELRPHQTRAIDMLRQSLRAGNKHPVLAAPTGAGKTVIAAKLAINAVEKGKRVLFVCDRIKLVQQSLEAMDRFGIEVGVIQGRHERTKYSAPVQIASIQTLARKPHMPIFDLCIIDECQVLYKAHIAMMETYNNVPFIGLSATPYSKGLGKYFDDLLVPITTRQLQDQGYLAPAKYYGGAKVNLKGVKKRALPTGGTDYDPKSLSESIEKDDKLTGDIIQNWLKYGQGRQTIAFTPSIRHSKELVRQFNEAGISAEHIDGYMDDEERQMLYKAHDKGEFMILSCSQLLNTGYDAPKVSCLVDCYPTASKITIIQRIGRVLRSHPDKEYAVILDHAGNTLRHGFSEDIVPDSLDDGEKRYDEKSLTKDKDKEPNVKECPQCHGQFVGLRCACGYEIPIKQQLESTDEILVELTAAEKRNRKTSMEDKAQFYSELMAWASIKGYSQGWAAHKYKERYSVWPNKVKPHSVSGGISDEVRKFITSQNIKNSKRRAA
jgi:superfamily II DNA or RNA helicase